MILVIDNYDSFTYNLVHYVGACGKEVLVVRNDEMDNSPLPQQQGQRQLSQMP